MSEPEDDSDDETGVVVVDTLDEAIAIAMADLEEGGEVHIHAQDCKYDAAKNDGCTCEPRVITRPAAGEA